MSFLHFIVNDVLGQASILISLIAMIGLIALKKSTGQSLPVHKNAAGFSGSAFRGQHYC